MDADEEKITGILRRLTSRTRLRRNRAECPDEETLAVFLSGSMDDTARNLMETHLASCSFCLEDLVAAYQSAEPNTVEKVPLQLVARVTALISGKTSLFDLAVRLVKDSIELVSTSARVVSAPSPLVRGAAAPMVGNSLQVEQEVGRFRVAVEIDLREAGTCHVIANVTEETGMPAEEVRLSLSSGDREQASFLTRGGTVVFDRIAPGEYSIAVSESGAVVGRIRLSLMM